MINMSIFSFLRRRKEKNSETVGLDDERLLEWLGVDTGNPKAINETTYFTCLKMLSETMGKLPLHYYQRSKDGRIRAEPTDMTRLLCIRPNEYMTPTTLWTTTEFLCQEYGNAYIWIQSKFIRSGRYGGQVRYFGLYPMRPCDVTVWMDDAGIFGRAGAIHYQYTNPKTGQSVMLNASEVMHFKTWYSTDGVMGEPVKKILADTIDGGNQSQKYMNNLYKNGLTASMVMQYSSDIDEDRVKQLKRKFADKLTGPQAAGKVIPLPEGLQLQPLSTKLTDAQFFELKKYTALQIAAAFGIKPNQINDYDKSSYSNSETQQLAFLVDTISYRLKMYEEEINEKCLTPEEQKNQFYYRFNEKALLRTDSKTQMDTICEAVQNGVYTPNEGREFLDLPDKEGGDVLMCNGNYIPITKIGSQYGNTAGSQQEGGSVDGNN